MGAMEWLAHNWFDLLSTVGIVGSLWFTAVSLRSDTKTRRTANLLVITANHREIWKEISSNPALARVEDPMADAVKQPVSRAEEAFVYQMIAHLSSVYESLKDDLLIKQEGLRRDVKEFFSLPVPKAVWSSQVGKLNHNIDKK